MTLMELRKFVAPEFVFGVGSRLACGRYLKNLGARKVLIVTDPGVIQAGWSEDIIESLVKENLQYALFSSVSPNPRDHEIMTVAEFYKSCFCDSAVVIGGGSVIDAAKGIGIVVSNDDYILEYEGVDQVPIPMPPLICIPTTGGTSADVSQFCIINDTVNRVKISIISKAVVPDVALIDPKCLLTMDAYLTACTGIDALVHALTHSLGEILGLDWKRLTNKQRKSSLQSFLIQMRSDLGIMGTLRKKGLHNPDLIELAEKTINDPCNATNPRVSKVKDLQIILEESM